MSTTNNLSAKRYEVLLKQAAAAADATFERIMWIRSCHPTLAKQFEDRLVVERRELLEV